MRDVAMRRFGFLATIRKPVVRIDAANQKFDLAAIDLGLEEVEFRTPVGLCNVGVPSPR